MRRIHSGVIAALSVTLVYTLVFGAAGKLRKAEAVDIPAAEYTSPEEGQPEPAGNDAADVLSVPLSEEDRKEQYIATSWWKADLSRYQALMSLPPETTSSATAVPETTTAETTTSAATTAAATTTTATAAATAAATSPTAVPLAMTAPATTTAPPETTTTKATPQTWATLPKETTEASATTTTAKTETSKPAKEEPENSEAWGDVVPSGEWGTLQCTVGGSKVTRDAFDVICQVVNSEMGASFETEALKAQAVASYSYFLYSNSRGTAPSVSFRGTVPDKVKNAVASVEGVVITYQGKPANTVYCASSGGYTACAEDVWGSPVPYLTSVESRYDSQDSNYGVKKEYSSSEAASIVQKTTGISLSGNPAGWFEILDECQGGYTGRVSIGGETTYRKGGKDVEITGRVVRENIFAFGLRSAKFEVNYDASRDKLVFTTYGYGHGVGMPQHGANLYASESGWDYLQILKHYYPGVSIS